MQKSSGNREATWTIFMCLNRVMKNAEKEKAMLPKRLAVIDRPISRRYQKVDRRLIIKTAMMLLFNATYGEKNAKRKFTG